MPKVTEHLGRALTDYLKMYPSKSVDLLRIESAHTYLKIIDGIRHLLIHVVATMIVAFLVVGSFGLAIAGAFTSIHLTGSNLGIQLIALGLTLGCVSGVILYSLLSSERWMRLMNGNKVLKSILRQQKHEALH